MTYYKTQVDSISTALYSNIWLIKQVIQARHFMDRNFPKAITLDDICDEACLSKFHLLRSFKKLYGRTPYQYLTSLRVVRAKELLKSGSLVEETGMSVGFESATSFTKFFNRAVGMSPKTYQQICLPACSKK